LHAYGAGAGPNPAPQFLMRLFPPPRVGGLGWVGEGAVTPPQTVVAPRLPPP
jgi:hypothetical protein